MIVARLQYRGAESPRVVLDDGRSLPVDYEVLDASGVRDADRVRVEVDTGDAVTRMLPLLPADEALAVLERSGVLTAASNESGDMPWAFVIFEEAWNTREPSVFCCDGEYLDEGAVGQWLERSGVTPTSITPGPEQSGEPSVVVDAGHGPRAPVRPVAFDLFIEVNEILQKADAPYRWYDLPSHDDRAVFLRVDRATATALGIGPFDR